MKDYIEERAVEIAVYIIENNATVRQTAKQFRISKSTVHKDVTERLTQINPTLAREARKVLDTNKSERHIRGGRDGNTGKVSASAYLDVGLSEYCLKSLDATLYQVIFLGEILLKCNYRKKYEIISQICLQKLNHEYNRR